MTPGASKVVDEDGAGGGVGEREQGVFEARRGGGRVSQSAPALPVGSEGADIGEERGQGEDGGGREGISVRRTCRLIILVCTLLCTHVIVRSSFDNSKVSLVSGSPRGGPLDATAPIMKNGRLTLTCVSCQS